MAGRKISLGDGKEAGEPRLRGQKVVAAGIGPVLGHRIADDHQLAVGIEKKSEIHRQRHLARRSRKRAEPRRENVRRGGEFDAVALMLGDRFSERADPEGEIVSLRGRSGARTAGGGAERLRHPAERGKQRVGRIPAREHSLGLREEAGEL